MSGNEGSAAATQSGRLVGGRYRLVHRLGAGGFGSVWQARDEVLGVEVAVKEVRLPPTASAAEQAERLARAQREARHAARLRDHPNVVGVHDVVVDDGVPWTVMQLIVGRSLEEQVARHGPLDPAQAARVGAAVLTALGAAHQAGIVHRDVKPANILLADDGRVLLADFGIAVQRDDTALTATGAFIGSVEYLAPERARGQDAGPAGDLFSLGATLYYAVEGRAPFRRDSPAATLTAVLFDTPEPPQRAGALAALITGLLAKDPATRLTGPQAAALLVSLPNSAPPYTPTAPGTTTPPGTPRPLRLPACPDSSAGPASRRTAAEAATAPASGTRDRSSPVSRRSCCCSCAASRSRCEASSCISRAASPMAQSACPSTRFWVSTASSPSACRASSSRGHGCSPPWPLCCSGRS
ncbi:serine/threonine-protein kinase [Streptacidiphilus monticola]